VFQINYPKIPRQAIKVVKMETTTTSLTSVDMIRITIMKMNNNSRITIHLILMNKKRWLGGRKKEEQ
jgi:hypothetical protein